VLLRTAIPPGSRRLPNYAASRGPLNAASWLA
jgi:hypothetical protein